MCKISKNSRNLSGVIQKYYKLDRHCGPSTTSKNVKELEALKWSYKNIFKPERNSEAPTTSEKYLGPPGTPGGL